MTSRDLVVFRNLRKHEAARREAIIIGTDVVCLWLRTTQCKTQCAVARQHSRYEGCTDTSRYSVYNIISEFIFLLTSASLLPIPTRPVNFSLLSNMNRNNLDLRLFSNSKYAAHSERLTCCECNILVNNLTDGPMKEGSVEWHLLLCE